MTMTMHATEAQEMITVDPEFKALLSPLSQASYEGLEDDIQENGCRDPLIVWQEAGILLDGHHRYSICTSHGIPFDVDYVCCESREAAKRWIIEHQVDRRNLAPKELSYLRGGYYASVKGERGNKTGNNQYTKVESVQNAHFPNEEKVRDQVAKKFGVNTATIARDHQFFNAINAIAQSLGETARFTLVSAECKLNKEEIRHLAKIFGINETDGKDCYYSLVGEQADTKRKPSQILKQYGQIANRGKALVEDELNAEEDNSSLEEQLAQLQQNGHQEKVEPTSHKGESRESITEVPQKEYDDSKEQQVEESSTVEDKLNNRPQLSLSEPESEDKSRKPHTEEIEDEKGRKIYVKHTPNTKPVFNSANEEIDWAFWTWNPVTGCWHGCEYCYARDIAFKFDFETGFEPTFYPDRLKAPSKMKPMPENQIQKKATERNLDIEFARVQAKNVFTGSMSDIFGKWVPIDWIERIFNTVKSNPQWNFLFLTKFPQRLQEVNDMLGGFPDNVWVGTSVDTQARVKVAEKAFKGISARLKWLSCEPMLEELTFNDLSGFDLVVIGGASPSNETDGSPATPEIQPKWEWVWSLTNQAYRAGCSVYWKENLKTRPKEIPLNQIKG